MNDDIVAGDLVEFLPLPKEFCEQHMLDCDSHHDRDGKPIRALVMAVNEIAFAHIQTGQLVKTNIECQSASVGRTSWWKEYARKVQ